MAIVLLVEESQTIRRVVEMGLKGSGHDIIAAGNGAECRQALYQYGPGVVLINYILPDVSGLDLCREIKSNPATAYLPVVVLGGTYAPFNENQAHAVGADAVLIKPFLTDDLVSTIGRLVSMRPAARPPMPAVAEQPSYGAGPAPVLSQPAPYAPTPPPRPMQPAEMPAYGPGYGAPAPPPPTPQASAYGYAQQVSPPSGPSVQPSAYGYAQQVSPPSAPSIASPTASALGRGPASREVSSSQRAPFGPPVRYPTGQQVPVSATPRPPSGRFPRGFQPPATQPAPLPAQPPARIPSGVAPVAPAAPSRPQAAPPQPEPPARPAAATTVDPQELRAALKEVLPPIVRDALRQLFRDGLESRLKNYVQDRVDQFMREEARQIAIQAIQEEILRQRGRG